MKTGAMIIPLNGTVKTTPKKKSFPHIAIICILSMAVFTSPMMVVEYENKVDTDAAVLSYVDQEFCGSASGWYEDTLYAVANGVTHKVWYDEGVQVDAARLTVADPIKIDNWNEIVAQAALTVKPYREPVRELPDLSDIKDLTMVDDKDHLLRTYDERDNVRDYNGVKSWREMTRHEQEIAKAKYIRKYKDLALFQKEKYGIPASLKLAQGMWETAAGTSELSRYGNHFGIKCFERDCAVGSCRQYHDDSPKDRFKVYKSVGDSFEDHSIKLYNDRYRYGTNRGNKTGGWSKCDSKDYKCWARAIAAGGWATDKRYASRLINWIEKYELYKYD